MTGDVDVDALREYCDFGDDRVYLLMAIAREKDNDGDAGDVPVVREVVTDADALGRTIDQLDHAVSRFDPRFRLYLSANARDALAATFELRSRTDDWIRAAMAGDDGVRRKFGRIDSEFKSTLQSDGCRAETNFVFDLDGVDREAMATLRDRLADHTTVRITRETPNGFHVVTEPFDYNRLAADVDYELKTDAMLFLSFLGE